MGISLDFSTCAVTYAGVPIVDDLASLCGDFDH